MAAVSVQLVYPLCAMFLLTSIVMVRMVVVRVGSVRSGKINGSYFKTYNVGETTAQEAQISRHFSNLFEMPVMFYVACIVGMILPVEGLAFVVLAWAYVAARVMHAYIHIGSNKIYPRMACFAFGWIILTAMWILILLKALSISAIS